VARGAMTAEGGAEGDTGWGGYDIGIEDLLDIALGPLGRSAAFCSRSAYIPEPALICVSFVLKDILDEGRLSTSIARSRVLNAGDSMGINCVSRGARPLGTNAVEGP
jgi:hypothetical protein